ncbi:MAG: DinB family protein [Spirochaetes bacterium]|nr:DinB family protein [Spirochaetota bacterium]
MKECKDVLIQIINNEFHGPSFNGPSLMETLKKMDLTLVVNDQTYESYTVWQIVLHIMYYKYFLIKNINPEHPLSFPYEEADFPSLPDELSQKNWEKTLSDLEYYHKTFVEELVLIPDEKLDDPIEEWKCPIRSAVAWIATHDTYHVAQIRNMGLPDLKGK